MAHSVLNRLTKLPPPGIGHRTQQESPAEVNRLLIEFILRPQVETPGLFVKLKRKRG